MEQCQLSGARYTRCLFLLSHTLLYLAEKRFNEANPLLQQVTLILYLSRIWFRRFLYIHHYMTLEV
jgi:hypothetical protein